MGCGSSKSGATYTFKNGKPSVEGTAIEPMFNSMLYRIADKNTGRWAFYNDTTDQFIHVAIIFDYDSQVLPLGETFAFRVDDPDEGNEDDFGKYVCQVDVMPGETQPFVEGTVTGWKVDTLEVRNLEDERMYRL